MDNRQQMRDIRPTISTLAPTTKHPPPALQATACRVDWGGAKMQTGTMTTNNEQQQTMNNNRNEQQQTMNNNRQ
jgi:hypothetical protein